MGNLLWVMVMRVFPSPASNELERGVEARSVQTGLGGGEQEAVRAPDHFELVDAQTYATGAALHVYRPALAAA